MRVRLDVSDRHEVGGSVDRPNESVVSLGGDGGRSVFFVTV